MGSATLSRELLEAMDRLPPFPLSVQRILKLTSEVSCSPKDLVEAIHNDPIVTLKVLRAVNSAYYGLTRQIASIDHAVVLLGFNTIKNLALGIAAVGLVPTSALSGFDAQRFISHSLLCAALARKLAQSLPEVDAHECFIAGLLHDVGQVALAQVMPQQFRMALEYGVWNETSLHTALLAVAEVDCAQVGASLLQKWRFPESLALSILHQYEVATPCTPQLACLVAANAICNQLGLGFADHLPPNTPWPDTVLVHLGASPDGVMAALGDLGALVEEARHFARL